MKTAREWAHEAAERDGNELCPPHGHLTDCDERTAIARAVQIDALKWALSWAGIPPAEFVIREKLRELEAESLRPGKEGT